MAQSRDTEHAWAVARAKHSRHGDTGQLWQHAIATGDTILMHALLQSDTPAPDSIGDLTRHHRSLAAAWARRNDADWDQAIELARHGDNDMLLHALIDRADTTEQIRQLTELVSDRTGGGSPPNAYPAMRLLETLKTLNSERDTTGERDNPSDSEPDDNREPPTSRQQHTADTVSPGGAQEGDGDHDTIEQEQLALRLVTLTARQQNQNGHHSAKTLAELYGTRRRWWLTALEAGDRPVIAAAGDLAGQLSDETTQTAAIGLLERGRTHWGQTPAQQPNSYPGSDTTAEAETLTVAWSLAHNLHLTDDNARRLADLVAAVGDQYMHRWSQDRIRQMHELLTDAWQTERHATYRQLATGDRRQAAAAWETLTAANITGTRDTYSDAAARNSNAPVAIRQQALGQLMGRGALDTAEHAIATALAAGNLTDAARLVDTFCRSHHGWADDLLKRLEHTGQLEPILDQLGPANWLLRCDTYTGNLQRVSCHPIDDIVNHSELAAAVWDWLASQTRDQDTLWDLAANWRGTPAQLLAVTATLHTSAPAAAAKPTKPTTGTQPDRIDAHHRPRRRGGAGCPRATRTDSPAHD